MSAKVDVERMALVRIAETLERNESKVRKAGDLESANAMHLAALFVKKAARIKGTPDGEVSEEACIEAILNIRADALYWAKTGGLL